MRFRPQIFDMSVDVKTFPLQKADVDTLVEHFITSYEARFGTGSAFRAAGIEISAFRIVARARLNRAITTAAVAAPATPTSSKPVTRKIYTAGAWRDAAVYSEDIIRPGFYFEGPAVVEFDDTSLVIDAGQKAEVDTYLNVIITTRT